MAIIKCSECGKDVSDRADKCPNCGNLTKNNDQGMPVLVEPVLVSKKWKRVKLYSWGFIVLGLIFMSQSGEPSLQNIGFLLGMDMSILAFIGLVIGHIGAWYEDRRAR